MLCHTALEVTLNRKPLKNAEFRENLEKQKTTFKLMIEEETNPFLSVFPCTHKNSKQYFQLKSMMMTINIQQVSYHFYNKKTLFSVL